VRLAQALRQNISVLMLTAPDRDQLRLLERRYWQDQELQADIRRFFTRGRGPLDTDTFTHVMVRAHRDHWPEFLYEAWRRHRISTALMRSRVAEVFAWVRTPEALLPTEKWLTLFRHAGFTHDGVPASPPSGVTQLWRASAPEHRFRMSWTPSLSTARGYAAGQNHAEPGAGRIYTAHVPPERVLAVLDAKLANPLEVEWIVNTRGLEVEEISLASL